MDVATDSSTVQPAKQLNKPLAFVIMPFERAIPSNPSLNWKAMDKENLDTIYDLIVEALSTEYDVRRATGPGDILQGIMLNLHRATLVVAELSGLNPNVMYELGIRHSFPGRKTLLLTQDINEVPFDLNRYYLVEYKWINSGDRKRFVQDVQKQLRLMDEAKDAIYGPVETYLRVFSQAATMHDWRAVVNRLGTIRNELLQIIGAGAYVLNHVARFHPSWFTIRSGRITLDLTGLKNIDPTERDDLGALMVGFHASHPCMNLLLSDYYLPDEICTQAEHHDIYEAFSELSSLVVGVHPSHFRFRFVLECIRLSLVLMGDAEVIAQRLNGNTEALRMPLGCGEFCQLLSTSEYELPNELHEVLGSMRKSEQCEALAELYAVNEGTRVVQ